MSGSGGGPTPASGKLDDYIIELGGYAWGRLLAPWSPPLPATYDILIISRFCDVFVIVPDGGVVWVNTQQARVDRVAESRAEFKELLKTQMDVFLKTSMVDGLVRVGVRLGRGQVYGLQTPATEGGKFERSNIGAASIEDSFGYLGQLYLVKTGAAELTANPQSRNS